MTKFNEQIKIERNSMRNTRVKKYLNSNQKKYKLYYLSIFTKMSGSDALINKWISYQKLSNR